MFVVSISKYVVTTLWHLVATVLLKVEIDGFYCWFYCVTVNLFALVKFWAWLYVREWYVAPFVLFVLWWCQWWLGLGWWLFVVVLDFVLLLYDCIIIVIIRINNFILAVWLLNNLDWHYLLPASTIINSIMRPFFIINLFVLHHHQSITNTLFVSFPPFIFISLLFFLYLFFLLV